jgi:hypothetical protein
MKLGTRRHARADGTRPSGSRTRMSTDVTRKIVFENAVALYHIAL